MQQNGHEIPNLASIKPDQWEQLLNLNSKTARKRYYRYLWLNETRALFEKIKKEEKKIIAEERLRQQREDNQANNHIKYGLFHNTIFLRIHESTMDHFHNQKLIRAMMFDQKLVIDCSYDQKLSNMEARQTGRQLNLSFYENRRHTEPFDLHLCNVDMNSVSTKSLKTMLDPGFPLNVHTKSMTEIFDRDKLVYLTPHCSNYLEKFNHDDIYIIGAIVDTATTGHFSLEKAKEQGLRMARLPLERYLQWGRGGKSLTINQMVQILLEMKKHGDWEKALQIVPRRKLAGFNPLAMNNPKREQFKRFQLQRIHQQISQSDNFNNLVTEDSDADLVNKDPTKL